MLIILTSFTVEIASYCMLFHQMTQTHKCNLNKTSLIITCCCCMTSLNRNIFVIHPQNIRMLCRYLAETAIRKNGVINA